MKIHGKYNEVKRNNEIACLLACLLAYFGSHVKNPNSQLC